MVKKGETAPEYLLILYHDMLPHEEIISDAFRHLQRDPKNGFVQYPQRFSDIMGNNIIYSGNEILFDGVQVNRSCICMASFAGTNSFWNLKALYHVGGLQYGSLTKDVLIIMAAHMTVYLSIYSQTEMAVGQSPQTVKYAMQQRMCWSQGAIEIALKIVEKSVKCQSIVEKVPIPKELVHVYKSKNISRPYFLEWFFIFVIYLYS